MWFFKRKKFKLHAHQYSKFNLSYRSRVKFSLRGFFAAGTAALRRNKNEILAFLFVVLVAWAFLQSARLSAIALQVKEKITLSARGGAANLQTAKNSLASQDLDKASSELILALDNFKQSQKELKALEDSLLGATRLLPQSRSAENLLSASVDLAKAGQSAVNFLKFASSLSFGAAGLTRGEASFDGLISEIKNFREQLQSAVNKINKADISSLTETEKVQINGNLEKISFALKSSESLGQMLSLGKAVFSGQKKVLLLMQNQNELRPTGGFIGSYGNIRLNEGKIEKLEVSSIYDLDGQLTENIEPPGPVVSVNSRWFLRDANWFTSFDESAKKISGFYEKEGGETPDFIIALTPKAISGLLEVTGPVETTSGQKIDSENLIEILQVLTQSDALDPSNEPKKILGQLFTLLFQKIGDLDTTKKALALKSLQASLSGKQILLYSRASGAQKILEDFNWAGKISKSDRDYLLVSGANLGGTKTDLEIEQSLKLESSILQNGSIENTLTIIRTNNMPDLPGAENKTFLRIYAPLGSKFKEAVGFDRLSLEKGEDLGNRTDPEIFKWEKSQVKDIVSGTLIGEESGKTFFGNWIVLKGGETKTLRLKYTLPFKLKNLDHHSLVLQKQPGAQDFSFEYLISLPGRNIEWKNFSGVGTENRSAQASAVLNKDLFFGMVLRKDN